MANAFNANKVVNIIKRDIEENFNPGFDFTVANFFGITNIDLERKFTEANCIVIIYRGCEYQVHTSNSMKCSIDIEFVLLQQIVAAGDEKEDYLIDLFRNFITWREFTGLTIEYPTSDFEPFFPATEGLLATTESGVALVNIRGVIRCVKRNIGG